MRALKGKESKGFKSKVAYVGLSLFALSAVGCSSESGSSAQTASGPKFPCWQLNLGAKILGYDPICREDLVGSNRPTASESEAPLALSLFSFVERKQPKTMEFTVADMAALLEFIPLEEKQDPSLRVGSLTEDGPDPEPPPHPNDTPASDKPKVSESEEEMKEKLRIKKAEEAKALLTEVHAKSKQAKDDAEAGQKSAKDKASEGFTELKAIAALPCALLGKGDNCDAPRARLALSEQLTRKKPEDLWRTHLADLKYIDDKNNFVSSMTFDAFRARRCNSIMAKKGCPAGGTSSTGPSMPSTPAKPGSPAASEKPTK